VTLTDTGPIVALLDPRQQHHVAAREVVAQASLPLITTWPCLTEAMYFAQREGGFLYESPLIVFVRTRMLRLFEAGEFTSDEDVGQSLVERISQLMAQYKDLPMDFADASLVAAAEHLSLRRVFTLDSDFHIYRTKEGGAFEVIPA
jgi:predicted nucleic acid-binding protein